MKVDTRWQDENGNPDAAKALRERQKGEECFRGLSDARKHELYFTKYDLDLDFWIEDLGFGRLPSKPFRNGFWHASALYDETVVEPYLARRP